MTVPSLVNNKQDQTLPKNTEIKILR